MSKEPTPLERLAMKWEARRLARPSGGVPKPERRGVPLDGPQSTERGPRESPEGSSSSSSSDDDDSSSSSSSESSDSDESSSSSCSSSSSSSCSTSNGGQRKPGTHKRKFKPNTHMLSSLVKGQVRTNERMDREQTENAQERLDTMDGGRSFTKVRIMTSYLTEHGSTGIAGEGGQEGDGDDQGEEWDEWERQKRFKFGS